MDSRWRETFWLLVWTEHWRCSREKMMPKLFKILENFLQCSDSKDLPSPQTLWQMWLWTVLLCFRRGLLFWRGHHCWSPSDVGGRVQWRTGSFCQKCHCRNRSGTGQLPTVFYLLLFSYFRHPFLTAPGVWPEIFCERFGDLYLSKRIQHEFPMANSLGVKQRRSGIEMKSFGHRLVSLHIVNTVYLSKLCLVA